MTGPKQRGHWPPRMQRLPLELGEDSTIEPCTWHATVAATCRVRTYPAPGRIVWRAVCQECADQVEDELRAEL